MHLEVLHWTLQFFLTWSATRTAPSAFKIVPTRQELHQEPHCLTKKQLFLYLEKLFLVTIELSLEVSEASKKAKIIEHNSW
jgi:hypothetical protein